MPILFHHDQLIGYVWPKSRYTIHKDEINDLNTLEDKAKPQFCRSENKNLFSLLIWHVVKNQHSKTKIEKKLLDKWNFNTVWKIIRSIMNVLVKTWV